MENIKKLSILTLLILNVIVPYGLCSENYAGDFLELGAGARALGMGGAFVVATDGATSAYHNPAGLAKMKVREINLMHSEQFAGLINYNTVSFGSPVSSDLFLGVSLLHSGIGNIKYTTLLDPSKPIDENNRPEIASREDATDYTMYFSGARSFSGKFDVGASVKIIRRSIGPDTAFGYGIDIGVQYCLNNHWQLGAAYRDVTGTTVAWDGKANDRIASTLNAGLSYISELPLIGGELLMTGSMLFFGDSPNTKGLKTMHFGGEYIIADILAFRAGSNAGAGTFGIGIMRLPLISSSSVDYAFLSDDGLDSTHRVSMSIRF